MHSLLYVSTPCALPNPAAMARIAAAARALNPGLDVSGMLLWSDSSFAQLLEGPAEAVDATFARVRRDARHRDLRPIARWAGLERLFAGRPMGLARLSEQDGWRLLQRRTAPGDGGFGPWLTSLMRAAAAAGVTD